MARIDMEQLSRVLHRALSNMSQNMTDRYIEKNAQFRYDAGLSQKIIRTSSGHCCEWCNQVAGKYAYPDVPKDVYRRHDNCDCTVDYVTGKQKQNVWNKKKRIDESILNMNDGSDSRKMLNENIEDVTKKYIENANPNKGKIFFEDKTEPDDKEIVRMLHNIFGGDIRCLAERATIGNMPDSLWNGKYWEFKRPTTIKAIDARIRKAQEQLCNASSRDKIKIGGMVIDISRTDCKNEEMLEEIIVRIDRRCNVNQDIIISRDEKVIRVLRYRIKG